MDNEQIATLRAAFEFCMSDEDLSHRSDGRYRFPRIESEWRGWLSCAEHGPQAAEIARLKAELAALVRQDDDPIGDMQAEARQRKLDDFVAETPMPQLTWTITRPVADSLINAIMNIAATPVSAWPRVEQQAYKLGHRDARHAAAELAAMRPATESMTDARDMIGKPNIHGSAIREFDDPLGRVAALYPVNSAAAQQLNCLNAALAAPSLPAVAPQDPMAELSDEQIEAGAIVLYESWQAMPGYVQWKNGGNSHKQDQARDISRAILAAARSAK